MVSTHLQLFPKWQLKKRGKKGGGAVIQTIEANLIHQDSWICS